MPGNTIKINNREELSWYVGDSKMDTLIEWLNDQGIKNYIKPGEVHKNIEIVELCFPDSSEPKSTEVLNISKMDRLNGWLDDLIYPGETSDFIHNVGVEEPAGTEIKRKFYLYTSDYRYMIVAIDRENDKGYLGCQVSTRKQRAGEDWFRGNDLADGSFDKDTWNRILNSIIRYEIVKLTTHKRPETTPENVGQEIKIC